jgi:hypothetical protein
VVCSIVDWLARHLVVGLKQCLAQQPADVASLEPIDHPATLSVRCHESGKAKLRKVLACHRGPTSSNLRQGSNVKLLVTQCPEHPDADRIGQQGKRDHCGLDLLACGYRRMNRAFCPRSRGGHTRMLSAIASYSHLRICRYCPDRLSRTTPSLGTCGIQ